MKSTNDIGGVQELWSDKDSNPVSILEIHHQAKMKGFLEGFIFRPQGGPMAYPYGIAAKFSRFPYRYLWHESWQTRYFVYATVFVMLPLYWQIDKVLTGPENKAYWREKRKHDREHHEHELKKKWEVRT